MVRKGSRLPGSFRLHPAETFCLCNEPKYVLSSLSSILFRHHLPWTFKRNFTDTFSPYLKGLFCYPLFSTSHCVPVKIPSSTPTRSPLVSPAERWCPSLVLALACRLLYPSRDAMQCGQQSLGLTFLVSHLVPLPPFLRPKANLRLTSPGLT